MAYTKIHAIKATVNKAIKYITNPAKTDGKMLVDSFGCTPETADHIPKKILKIGLMRI